MLAAAVVSIGAGSMRLRSHRQSPRPETRDLGIALIALGCGLTLSAPAVVMVLDRYLWRRANISFLVSNLAVLVTSWEGIEVYATSSRNERGRAARLAAVGAAGSTLTGSFLAAGPLPQTPRFFETYGRDPRLRKFWVTFFSAEAAASYYMSGITRSHAAVDDPWLRRGLNTISIGSAMTGTFMANRMIAVWAPMPRWVEKIKMLFLVGGSGLIAVGSALPQVAGVIHRRTAMRYIEPFWRDVTDRYPHIRRGAPLTVQRAVIEIQDALSEARLRDEVDTPLLRALDALPTRPSDDGDQILDDMLAVARSTNGQDIDVS